MVRLMMMMMMMVLQVTLLVMMVAVTGGQAQGSYTYAAYGDYDDYGTGGGVYYGDEVYEDYDEVVADSPVFISEPQHLSVVVGEDVTIPCHVDHLGEFVIILKKITGNGTPRFLFVGESPLKPAKRISKNGTAFTLRGARRGNAGQYVCRIESSPAVELTHSLDVLYAPSLRLVTPAVQEVNQGENVTLECHAEGNPHPNISWTKTDADMLTDVNIEDGILALDSVDIEDSGDYVCTATNGVTLPSTTTTATTRLLVRHPPQVTASQRIEEKDGSYYAELSCEVTGHPAPNVTWHKGDVDSLAPLPSTAAPEPPNGIQIDPLAPGDLGMYTCWAENMLGSDHSTVTIDGFLPAPEVTSDSGTASPTSYTLTWVTPGDMPPVPATVYKLRLKQLHKHDGDNQNHHDHDEDNEEEADHEHDVSDNEVQIDDDYEAGGSSATSLMVEDVDEDADEEWLETYPMEESVEVEEGWSHSFEDLEPLSHYEVTVTLKNYFGWSPESKIFEFTTPAVTTTTTTTTTTTVRPPKAVTSVDNGCVAVRSRVLRVVVLAVAVLVLGAVVC